MANSVFIGFFGNGSPWSWSGSTLSLTGNFAASGQFLASDGTAAAPSYSFSSDTNTGFRWFDADRYVSCNAGGNIILWASTEIRIRDITALNWSSGDPTTTGPDVSLTRAAANRLKLAVGDVLNLAPTAFASLPTGAEGDVACVTDSNTATWGATIAGGGANNVLAFFNGTNWTVAGV